jgi:hypothetical protein
MGLLEAAPADSNKAWPQFQGCATPVLLRYPRMLLCKLPSVRLFLLLMLPMVCHGYTTLLFTTGSCGFCPCSTYNNGHCPSGW